MAYGVSVRILCAGLTIGGVLSTATASAQMLRIDFQDAAPFTAVWSGGTADAIVHGSSGMGSCGNGTYWNFSRVAPGAGNGGFNDRGYVRYRWCDYDVSRVSMGASGWTLQGSGFRPSSGWPATTFFGRFRMFIEQPIIVEPGGDNTRQMKFFHWHTFVYDGDQRVIAYLDSGTNCGRPDSTHVCFTIQRNINHTTDAAAVALPVGQWSHVQFSWRHGPQGSSYVKVWLNNNVESSPSAQDLNLSGAATLPNGTTYWYKDDAGYNNQFFIGDSANTGTMFDADFVYRLMDFELDTAFNPLWATGSTPSPQAPTNLRIIN